MICQGEPEKASCSSDIQCDVGLYCKNSRCTLQIEEGQECTLEDKCVNWALCNFQTCTLKASLPNGYTLDAPQYELCKSNHTHNDTDTKWWCYPGHYISSSDVKPQSGINCTYYNLGTADNRTVNELSVCGYP